MQVKRNIYRFVMFLYLYGISTLPALASQEHRYIYGLHPTIDSPVMMIMVGKFAPEILTDDVLLAIYKRAMPYALVKAFQIRSIDEKKKLDTNEFELRKTISTFRKRIIEAGNRSKGQYRTIIKGVVEAYDETTNTFAIGIAPARMKGRQKALSFVDTHERWQNPTSNNLFCFSPRIYQINLYDQNLLIDKIKQSPAEAENLWNTLQFENKDQNIKTIWIETLFAINKVVYSERKLDKTKYIPGIGKIDKADCLDFSIQIEDITFYATGKSEKYYLNGDGEKVGYQYRGFKTPFVEIIVSNPVFHLDTHQLKSEYGLVK